MLLIEIIKLLIETTITFVVADLLGNDKGFCEDKVDIRDVKCSLYLPYAEPTKC